MEVAELLRRAGLRVTPQRMEIVRVLFEMGRRHPSLAEVLEEVRRRIPTVSFSTLYLTIRRLEERGIVKVMELGGETRVEVNAEPHVNIVRTDTWEIQDVEDPELVNLVKERLGLEDKDFLINIFVSGKKISQSPSRRS